MTSGVSIYDLPDWWTRSHRAVRFSRLTAPAEPHVAGGRSWSPAMAATWFLITPHDHGSTALCVRRQSGRRAAARHQHRRDALHCLRLAGIDGRHRRSHAGQSSAGGRSERAYRSRTRRARGCRARRRAAGRRPGSVLGCFLGVLLVAVVQNGLNLLGISPYAFKMVIGLTILAAISLSNVDLGALVAGGSRRRGRVGLH